MANILSKLPLSTNQRAESRNFQIGRDRRTGEAATPPKHQEGFGGFPQNARHRHA